VSKISVLFVCLGNICRSPTAHAVFERKAQERGLASVIDVDSAGTGDWHLGAPPDRRATAAAAERGYDLSALRARQVTQADFNQFDYMLAMDSSNLSDLSKLAPQYSRTNLSLLLDYAPDSPVREVPDPYYGGNDGFARVLDMVEDACDSLLDHIETQIQE